MPEKKRIPKNSNAMTQIERDMVVRAIHNEIDGIIVPFTGLLLSGLGSMLSPFSFAVLARSAVHFSGPRVIDYFSDIEIRQFLENMALAVEKKLGGHSLMEYEGLIPWLYRPTKTAFKMLQVFLYKIAIISDPPFLFSLIIYFQKGDLSELTAACERLYGLIEHYNQVLPLALQLKREEGLDCRDVFSKKLEGIIALTDAQLVNHFLRMEKPHPYVNLDSLQKKYELFQNCGVYVVRLFFVASAHIAFNALFRLIYYKTHLHDVIRGCFNRKLVTDRAQKIEFEELLKLKRQVSNLAFYVRAIVYCAFSWLMSISLFRLWNINESLSKRDELDYYGSWSFQAMNAVFSAFFPLGGLGFSLLCISVSNGYSDLKCVRQHIALEGRIKEVTTALNTIFTSGAVQTCRVQDNQSLCYFLVNINKSPDFKAAFISGLMLQDLKKGFGRHHIRLELRGDGLVVQPDFSKSLNDSFITELKEFLERIKRIQLFKNKMFHLQSSLYFAYVGLLNSFENGLPTAAGQLLFETSFPAMTKAFLLTLFNDAAGLAINTQATLVKARVDLCANFKSDDEIKTLLNAFVLAEKARRVTQKNNFSEDQPLVRSCSHDPEINYVVQRRRSPKKSLIGGMTFGFFCEKIPLPTEIYFAEGFVYPSSKESAYQVFSLPSPTSRSKKPIAEVTIDGKTVLVHDTQFGVFCAEGLAPDEVSRHKKCIEEGRVVYCQNTGFFKTHPLGTSVGDQRLMAMDSDTVKVGDHCATLHYFKVYLRHSHTRQ